MKFTKPAASAALALTMLGGIGATTVATASVASASTRANISQGWFVGDSPLYQGCPHEYILGHDITVGNIKVLQQQINKFYTVKGWKTRIAEDGVFGSGTRTAVITTQRALGLSADGVVGAATRAALNIGQGDGI